jgi:type I restriction enzyme S subunit
MDHKDDCGNGAGMSASNTVSSDTDETGGDVLDDSLKVLTNRQLRKFKRYPAYKDSGIDWLDEIPDNWEITKLKRLCQFAYGDSLASEVRLEGEIEVYGSNGRVGMHTYANSLAPCLVIGRKGSFGKVNYSTRPVFAIDTTFLVDSRFTNADMRWLYYVLSDARLDSATKDSAIPGLDREDAYVRELCLCSVAEQRAIAGFLDRHTAKIDALVAKKERLIELLRENQAAVITRAVTKGLDPNVPMKDSGVEWLGKIPAHWNVNTLKNVCQRVFVGIAEAATFAYADDGVPMLRSTDVRANRIRSDEIRHIEWRFAEGLSGKKLKRGDIVTVRTGNAGVSAIVPVAYDGGQCFTLVVSRPAPPHDGRYFCYWLNAPSGQEQFRIEGVGTAQINISVPIVQNTIVCVPPSEEQRRIADFIEKQVAQWDSLMRMISEAIASLRELRISLISAAVTGKIDVREEDT